MYQTVFGETAPKGEYTLGSEHSQRGGHDGDEDVGR
jgi:hypothetical protein